MLQKQLKSKMCQYKENTKTLTFWFFSAQPYLILCSKIVPIKFFKPDEFYTVCRVFTKILFF